MRLISDQPSTCTCLSPDLHKTDWPEASFVECKKCLAVQVKFNTSPDSFTVPRRPRPVDVGDAVRMAGGVLSGVGAVALLVFMWGLP